MAVEEEMDPDRDIPGKNEYRHGLFRFLGRLAATNLQSSIGESERKVAVDGQEVDF
jgi:hypothetical protein